MAAIDKCYVNSHNDYKAFCDWAKGRSFITPRGVKVVVSNYIFDWEEDSFKDGDSIPIFNSPVIFDNYLFHNCYLPFIQDWLKDRYSDEKGYVKGLSNEITQIPTLPEILPCSHVSVLKKGLGNMPYKSYSDYTNKKSGVWLVDIENNIGSLWYNEEYDFWTLPEESDIITSSCAHFKNKSIKTIIRKILKKWKLPKGCKISIWDRTTEWKLLTK